MTASRLARARSVLATPAADPRIVAKGLAAPADLVFLAMGFTGAQREGLLDALGVEMDQRDNVVRDSEFMSTVPGVFVAGDIGRGQSLIVWAIAEGRSAAAAADAFLTGASDLPAPIVPTQVAQR